MSVWSNATQEELDASSSLNLFLECNALLLQIRRIAIQYVDVHWIDIDMAEEVLVHEGVIGFWMISWNTNVFVLYECQFWTSTRCWD